MRKCADMKYHFAAELRIYPSSQQKHIIAVNDGASRFVYNRMTANDRELHRLKKTAHLCPAYKGRIEYLELMIFVAGFEDQGLAMLPCQTL